MDNVDQPRGPAEEHSPTQPFRFTPGQPGGPPPYAGDPAYGMPPPGPQDVTPPGQPPLGGPPPQAPAGPPVPPWPQGGPPPPGMPQGPGGPWGYGPGPVAGQGGGQEQLSGDPWGYGPPAGPGQGQPPGGPWAGSGGPAGPPQPPGQRRGHSRRLRWGAGIAAVLLLAGGGTAAGLALSSTPANAAQAVALNAALTAPAHGCRSGAAAGAGARGTRGRASGAGHSGCLRRQLRQVKGMYGEVAFHTANGTQTLAFERGAVTAGRGSQLTVRAANGTEWTWNLASGSVIRRSGRTVPASQLASGTRVFVGGLVDGSSRDARLVLVHMTNRRPGGRSQWPSGSRSSGRGSSGGSGSGTGSSGGSASGAGS
jgi:hypothetical protein